MSLWEALMGRDKVYKVGKGYVVSRHHWENAYASGWFYRLQTMRDDTLRGAKFDTLAALESHLGEDAREGWE